MATVLATEVDVTVPAADAAAPILELRHLTRRFGGLVAVNDVSLVVPRGQILGVVGPNGAGKSTLINLITGHIRPSRGTVVIDGRDVTGARPWTIAQQQVARTFQIVKPFRGMTVRENVAVGALYGHLHDLAVADALRTADEMLELVGLAARATALPTELSVADARRLELAKALATRPRLLLLDEVMAGLRHKEIDASVELIHRLRDDGMTVIAVEHVMRAILSISDELVVLHQGSVLTSGKPRDVLSNEQVIEAYLGHRYVQRTST
jgi:branched-chain amino acid transport system ATP-binding protein